MSLIRKWLVIGLVVLFSGMVIGSDCFLAGDNGFNLEVDDDGIDIDD
ncbi:MAG: hypothetical protein AMXMBFR13_18940 [Phycisphaerae bacterium]|jgi:hypothetical protein